MSQQSKPEFDCVQTANEAWAEHQADSCQVCFCGDELQKDLFIHGFAAAFLRYGFTKSDVSDGRPLCVRYVNGVCCAKPLEEHHSLGHVFMQHQGVESNEDDYRKAPCGCFKSERDGMTTISHDPDVCGKASESSFGDDALLGRLLMIEEFADGGSMAKLRAEWISNTVRHAHYEIERLRAELRDVTARLMEKVEWK